ncbi:MAG: tRNA (guanosine(37)-N1)-methyltransferase TrmD [Terracidiphilus sp.]|jgi:tRNA (guanine37-N1)-methyltransferase
MRFEIVTIFPGFFASFFENGILRRALAEGLVEVGVHDLRTFTHDRHRTVDDRPFGGGEGMVLKPQPIADALASLDIQPKTVQTLATVENPALHQGMTSEHALSGVERVPNTGVEGKNLAALYQGMTSVVPNTDLKDDGALAPAASRPTVILLSAQGRPFTQSLAREIASMDRVILICGRYEGVDERINQLYCDMELSIGDYVLSGGELAAAVVVDATMRLLPGVLGNEASSEFESFGVPDADISTEVEGVPRSQHGAGGLLDYPHYTRPAEFAGLKVPEPLLNGDHQAIRRWRREQQLRKTLANRPDLLESAQLTQEDRKLLDTIRARQ